MPIVNVVINQKPYNISCQEGQQDYLKSLSQELNEKACSIAQTAPYANESKILVLLALMLADEIRELKSQNKYIVPNFGNQEEGDSLVKTLDTISEYIENLAKKMEKL